MRVQDLKEYMEIQVPYNKYVMNFFHQETPDNCCVVIIGSAGQSNKNIGKPSFQFLVRNIDPEIAEATAYLIFNHFDNKTKYEIGGTQIIMSRGQQSVPLYTGMDDSARHIYSVNVELIVEN